jgi:acyl carrier protein
MGLYAAALAGNCVQELSAQNLPKRRLGTMVMTEHEIFSCLAEIVEELTGTPASRVTHEADITDDLGVSSLSMVEMITSAEDKFSVEIPDGALNGLRTVQDVVSYVQRAQRSGVGLSMPGDSAPQVAAT